MDYQAKTDWSYNDTVTEQDMNRIEAGLGDLHERLDVDSYEQLTLKPGLQIVNAKKNSPFQLTGLKGRTLLNLLGRTGGMESLSGIFVHNGSMVLDSTNKTMGANSLKVTSSTQAEGDSGIAYIPINNLKSGSYYVVIADVKNGNNANGLYVGWGGGFGGSYTSATVTGDRFTTIWKKFSPTTVLSGNIDLAVQSISGKYGYFDSVRVYELNSDEYKSIDNLTADQVNQYYPYVDSLSPVRNPYAITYGENLLPTLQEWTNTEGTPSINNRYSVDVSSANKIIHNSVAVVPGATYTLSAVSSSSTGRIFVYNTNGAVALADSTGSGSISAVFTVPQGVNVIEVRLLGTSTTAVNLSNVMLNVGTTSKPFKPREDTMLALQTDLYANPVTGTNADEVFERDGQYFRLAKWKKIVLDGSLAWGIFGMQSGYKVLMTKIFNPIKNTSYITKHDGKLLGRFNQGDPIIGVDFQVLSDSTEPNNPNVTAIVVSNTDSGWNDNYAPTLDEIKAYFYGWRMFTDGQDALINQYNGSGTKRWVKIGHTVTGNIPQADYTYSISQIGYGYVNLSKSYELVYQLAKPFLEPIISEGQLLLQEWDNQIEVGSGIVLRESTKPLKDPFTGGIYWNINNGSSSYESSLTKNKISRIIGIYKNGHSDNWIVYPKTITSAGVLAQKVDAEFDINSSYSISYITLNQTPMVNISGKYGLNEKTILQELISGFQQSNTRLSVVENKKVDKDISNWITVTLINGWSGTIQYMKLSSGLVVFRGSINGGLTTVGTLLFTIPFGLGFRTTRELELRLRTSNGSNDASNSTVIISNNGRVTIQNNWYNAGAWFDGISYIGEQ